MSLASSVTASPTEVLVSTSPRSQGSLRAAARDDCDEVEHLAGPVCCPRLRRVSRVLDRRGDAQIVFA